MVLSRSDCRWISPASCCCICGCGRSECCRGSFGFAPSCRPARPDKGPATAMPAPGAPGCGASTKAGPRPWRTGSARGAAHARTRDPQQGGGARGPETALAGRGGPTRPSSPWCVAPDAKRLRNQTAPFTVVSRYLPTRRPTSMHGTRGISAPVEGRTPGHLRVFRDGMGEAEIRVRLPAAATGTSCPSRPSCQASR